MISRAERKKRNRERIDALVSGWLNKWKEELHSDEDLDKTADRIARHVIDELKKFPPQEKHIARQALNKFFDLIKK